MPLRILYAILIAAVAGLFFGSPATASQQNRLDANEINKSIVWVDVHFDAQVEIPFEDGATEVFDTTVVSLCTGWFASEEAHVATAGHCLEFDSRSEVEGLYRQVLAENNFDPTGLDFSTLNWDYSIADPRVYIDQPSGIEGGVLSGEDAILAQVLGFQSFQNGDNALLKIANMDGTPALTIATTEVAVGDEVRAVGFPGSVSGVTDESRQAPSHKSGQVSSLSTSSRGVPNIEIDAAVSGGMSGGPTLNQQGEVVGINSFGITGESQPFNFITDTETMRQFFEGEGLDVESAANNPPSANQPEGGEQEVPVAPVPAESSSDDGGNVAGAVAAGVGGTLLVLAVLGGVGYWLWRKKKQQSASSQQTPPGNDDTAKSS